MPRPPTPGLRDRMLDAAESLFVQRGFHGVSVRDIARAAETPVSNLYAHFGNKQTIFSTLLERYEAAYFDVDTPMARVFASFRLPESIVEIGFAIGETVSAFASYLKLIYVDVVEFDGVHIGRLFATMRSRYEEKLGPYLRKLQEEGKLAAGDPTLALMTISLSYFNYFTVEKLFGVRRHFGVDDDEAVRAMGRLFESGLMAPLPQMAPIQE